MSCSLTLDAVRDRRKTVTRRAVETWQSLAVGDHLTLIEKGMGLAKGERQIVVAEVEIVSVRIEPLSRMRQRAYGITECEAEGFPQMQRHEFIEFWMRSHHETDPNVLVRRIEWAYLL